MYKHRFFSLVGVWLLLVAGSVFAHQQKSAITSVLFNPNTGNIEVSHRFYLHDAEHAVKQLFGKDADIYKKDSTRQDFANYVSEHFFIQSADNHKLPLTMVGAELEGKFVWIYQETVEPPELRGLTVHHDALRDLWPSQVNTVNVEGKGPIRTLQFDQRNELLRVKFSSRHH